MVHQQASVRNRPSTGARHPRDPRRHWLAPHPSGLRRISLTRHLDHCQMLHHHGGPSRRSFAKPKFKGWMQNPAVPSPPAARTDDADEPRASRTSSAASLEDDLAMVADWHVKQEDRTEVSHASSARDVSCMAQAVDDHRRKRPREHSLDPAAYRVRTTHALPVNPDIDPPFPGTEWHLPFPSAL